MRHPDRITPASDIFSLGCCYYYLLTGKEPYDGDSLIDLAVNIHTEMPQEFESLSPEDQAILEVMLDPDPTQRPQHGADLAQFLQSFEEEMAQQTSASSRLRVSTRSRSRRRRRR